MGPVGDPTERKNQPMARHMSKTLRRLWTVAMGLSVLLGSAPAFVLAGEVAAPGTARGKPKSWEKEVFSCDFRAKLARPWKMVGGKWKREDGCLKQTDPRPADPTKAIIVIGDAGDMSSDVSIVARLRLDSWKDGEWARAGISVCSDPTSGHGSPR